MIGEDGKMAGVMAPEQALQMAEDLGLDLIEIAPTAKPPTCRIMDYGKWRYENQKKEKAARKKQTVISIKEIQIRPRTDDHDLNVKLKHARKFLLAGDKVKVNLRFYGREMAHQELGIELLNKVSKMLDEVSNVETTPKKEGRQVFVLLAPDAAKIKLFQEKKPEGEADVDAETEAASGEDSGEAPAAPAEA